MTHQVGQQWWFIALIFGAWFLLLCGGALAGLWAGGYFDKERQARIRQIHEEYVRRFGSKAPPW